MNCREVNSKLADLLLDSAEAHVNARRHLEGCAGCRKELAELRATMNLMDEWAVPEVNAFFDAKLLARLRAERQATPAGFWERLRARVQYGSSMRMQPLMAGALAIIFLAGGGTYFDLAVYNQRPQESATVRDLQSLDGNYQVFQQLDSVDQTVDQQEPAQGAAADGQSSD
jgi:anti-sigma factor RsiW